MDNENNFFKTNLYKYFVAGFIMFILILLIGPNMGIIGVIGILTGTIITCTGLVIDALNK